MPNLTNAEGQPTGAMYGVLNMLRKISQQYSADYMACVFDAKGKTFRNDLYREYKSNRPPMPDELAQQIKPIHKAIEAMGWPIVCVEGVEADDVIATLARWASEAGLKTVVSTGDKDLAQLVDQNVTLVNTMSNETLDPEGVKNKFSVDPEQIVDYLMLIGDNSDNVPGVSKVGPKTAAKLLDKYGSLDEIIKHADEIKGVVGQNLRDAIDQFDLTRELITVRRDCDLGENVTSLEDLSAKKDDKALLMELYERYGLRSMLRDLQADGGAGVGTAPAVADEAQDAGQPAEPRERKTDYTTIVDMDALEDCIQKISSAEWVALDTETDSLDQMQARMVGMSLSISADQAWYIPLAHSGLDEQQLDKKEALNQLKPWLEQTQATKILHHAKYDWHVLANEGIHLQGILNDTLLMAYVLDSSERLSLEDLALKHLGLSGLSYEALCGKGKSAITFDQVPISKASEYACEDADFTFQLAQKFYPQIEKAERLQDIYALEMQLLPVLALMERQGVKIDADALAAQSDELNVRMDEIKAGVYELAGEEFNLNSSKQLGEILFNKLGLPVIKKTSTGAPSTNEAVLTELAQDYPLPKMFLEYRGLAKLKSTYTDKLPQMINKKTGRVHTNYSQASVVTGRLSSSDPNLQNIPVRNEEGRRIREAFVAEEGNMIMSADYSQIELRIMAHLSGDKNLQKAFAEGKDIHRATAAEIFHLEQDDVSAEQRRFAKAINFGLIYGMGVFGLANTLNITRDAAKLYIDRYFERYPGVSDYMQKIRNQAAQDGYVETVFGRRLWFRDLAGAKGPRKAAAERAAINAPMQGTAADLIKKAMVAVQQFIDDEQLKTQLIMQVHDELVFEVVPDEKDKILETLPDLMCNVAKLNVPLEVELGEGENWLQAH